MWLVCRTSSGEGKNKRLIRGIKGAEWVFCPLVRSMKKDKVSIGHCQGCRHFIRCEQTYVPQTYTTRKTFFFRALSRKDNSHLARALNEPKIPHPHTPLFSHIPSLIEERQPLVDIFEEKDHLIVIVELPGVEEKDMYIKADEDTLTIGASSKTKIHLKKVWLPTAIKKETIKFMCRNNVLQVKLEKLLPTRRDRGATQKDEQKH